MHVNLVRCLLQVTMAFVVACGAAIMGLHAYIVHQFPQQRVPSELVAKAERLAQRKRQRQWQRRALGSADAASSSAGAVAGEHTRGALLREVQAGVPIIIDSTASNGAGQGTTATSANTSGQKAARLMLLHRRRWPPQIVCMPLYISLRPHFQQHRADASLDEELQARRHSAGSGSRGATSSGSHDASTPGPQVQLAAAAEQSAPEKKKLTVREAFHFLAASKQVRCLALMAMAQGISTNLLEVSLPALIWCQLCYEGRTMRPRRALTLMY